MTITVLPDFAGDGAVHSVASLIASAGLPVPPTAYMILVREITGGSATSRIGDSTVAANRGMPFSASDNLLLPGVNAGVSLSSLGWDLNQLFIYAASGDTLAIAYAGF